MLKCWYASGVPTWSLPSPGHVAELVLRGCGSEDFLVMGFLEELEVTGLEELEVVGRAFDEPKKTTPLLVFRGHNPGLSNRRAWKRHRVRVQWSGEGSGAFLSSSQGWS